MGDFGNPFATGADDAGHTAEEIDVILNDLQGTDVSDFDIPAIATLPTLESILNEDDTDGGGSFFDSSAFNNSAASYTSGVEDASIASFDVVSGASAIRKCAESLKVNDSLIKLAKLRKVSAETIKQKSPSKFGNPTVVLIGSRLAIGTSTGYVHVFDLTQKLVCRCSPPAAEIGPVSAIDANREERRLLVGFAKGLLALYDLQTGKHLQTMEDVHSFECSILSIKFTDNPNMAIFTDNGGSVYALEFKSTLGRKSASSTCIFSGSKGEAFAAEPLLVSEKFPLHRFSETFIVAVVSLNKLIIAELKPVLRSVFSFPLEASPTKPPLLEWHIVTIQTGDNSKSVEPVLAVATGRQIVFVQVSAVVGEAAPKCSFIQRTTLEFDIMNIKWMNNYLLSVIDIAERLHVVDIRSQSVIDSVDISFVGLTYQSSFYKGLATTRSVSQAMALAGDSSCSQSIGMYQGQIVLLGNNGVFVASLRMWFERVERLVSKEKELEAIKFVLDIYSGQAKGVLGLTRDAQERRGILRRQVRSLIQTAIDRCLKSVPVHGKIDILKEHFEAVIPVCMEACTATGDYEFLFGSLYDRFSLDVMARSVYLQCLEPMILNDDLDDLSPGVFKDFIELYESRDQFVSIEACVVRLKVSSFDIHQVVGVCRQYDLFDGLAYVFTTAFADARTPLEEYLLRLRREMRGKPNLPDEIVALGNKLIVYLSCCLNGLTYPSGLPNDTHASAIALDVFQSLLARHSRSPDDAEPVFVHLRTLLDFNTRETLNVFAMAFNQPYFNDAKGLEFQQQLVDRLQQVVVHGEDFEPTHVSAVFTFIARLMTKPDAKIVINRMLIEQTLEVLCVADSRSRHDERETAVMELYHSGVLKHIGDKLVMKLAETAKFFRLCEILYEKHNMYDKLLNCYLDDSLRKGYIFGFLQRVLISPLYEEADRQLVRDAFIVRFADLLALDRAKTAQLTVSSLWNDVPRLLKVISSDIMGQYLFVKALFDFVLRTPSTATGSEGTAFPMEYHDIFIELMCQVRPDTVYDHIRSNDGFDADRALEVCRKYGLVKPMAYLLEKRGDADQALDILMEEFNRMVCHYLVSQRDEASTEEYEKTLHATTDTARLVMDFCQRVGMKMDQPSREKMWLRVLEFMLSAIKSTDATCGDSRKSDLRILCVDLLKCMTGHVDLLVFLKLILEDPAYRHGKFGELRDLLLGIVDAYSYETILLSSTRNLLYRDIHNQIDRKKKSASKAISVSNDTCKICDMSLRIASYSDDKEKTHLAVFRCGHAFHTVCLKNLQSTPSKSEKEPPRAFRCPECKHP
ncbi:Vacuolar protein sorting-associated protein 8-like protein [Hypsibius exemplaris]|uniref:Vacuolar protein sorting-associated protein 8-like protein n=1 Tax=Hypsibius exemplaris TaxID=2072580 RepID=A0A1W0WYL0_HYPEX|nr:Vacuolar protein sorting-associated protein 8-like protein [Hypsibius exemplaris]